MKISTATIESPIGNLQLTADEDSLLGVQLTAKSKLARAKTPILKEATKQFKEYFSGKRTGFSLPIVLSGTSFQIAVWDSLAGIGYGELLSYKEIAKKIGSPKAVRAVGTALGKNKFPIVLPCHRVIASGKKLGGFTGGLKIKKQLLKLEGASF